MKWDILWGKIEWQKQTGDDFFKKKNYVRFTLFIHLRTIKTI